MNIKKLFKESIMNLIKNNGYDPALLGKYAFAFYTDHASDCDDNFRSKLLDIANMEMGPEFELNKQEFEDFLSKI